jgi:hypothetical protein
MKELGKSMAVFGTMLAQSQFEAKKKFRLIPKISGSGSSSAQAVKREGI